MRSTSLLFLMFLLGGALSAEAREGAARGGRRGRGAAPAVSPAQVQQPEIYQAALRQFSEALIAYKGNQMERAAALAREALAGFQAARAEDFPGKDLETLERDSSLMLAVVGVAELRLAQAAQGAVRLQRAGAARAALIESIAIRGEFGADIEALGLKLPERKAALDEATRLHSGRGALRVSVQGGGAVRVRAGAQAALCRRPGDRACDQDHEVGADLVLEAVADDDSYLASWSGACVGAAPRCQLRLGDQAAVAASFRRKPVLTLRRTGDGRGLVLVQGAADPGLRCGDACRFSLAGSPVLDLAPRPASTSIFAGWSGACQGDAGCSLRMDQSREVQARFRRKTAAKWWVWTTAAGAAGLFAGALTVGVLAALNPRPDDVRRPGGELP